jgi:parallel beta helix pectate lyase-like protein
MERDSRCLHGIGGYRTAWPVYRFVAWGLLFALLTACDSRSSRLAFAEEAEGPGENATESRGSITGRAGYLAFETFGRDDSITHVEMMPYLELDQHTLFSDARLFMSNGGYFGGNVGFGYRYRVPEGNRFFGASFWYDLDDTTSEMFHQLGVSLESCGALWDVRTNLYIPIGDYETDYGIAVQDQQFAGNQVTFTGARTFGTAMTGFDLELGLPVPTEFARTRNISITPGTYMFFGDAAEEIYGYKIRAEGNVTSNVAMQVEMTDDDTFGTTVMLGVEFVLPGGSRYKKPADTSSRIRTDQFVHRNYNVIVSKQVDLRPGLAAINPETGQPYSVQHVSSAAGGAGLGTAEDPFHAISDAQAAAGDIIFVHGNSVLGNPVVMQAGEQILGEGVDHSILYDGYGMNLLPTVNNSAARPTLLGVSGTAVTLASDSQFSGFIVDSPTENGIFGDSISNVVVRDVDVLNAGLDGLYVRNSGDQNDFYELTITGAVGAAVHIDGGNSNTVIDGALDNSTGRAVVVESTTGGQVDLTGMVVEDDGGEGVLLENVDGDVSFGRVEVRNSSTAGIAMDGGSGDVVFANALVENAAGAGVDIRNTTGSFAFDDLDVTSQTGGPGVSVVDSTAAGTFSSVDIATNGATGMFVQNSSELAIEAGGIDSVNGTAVDIENATVDANLTSVSSSGAGVGIRIVDHQGQFLIVGSEADGSGGLIENATTGVLLSNAGTVGFQYVDFDGNGVGIDVADTERLALSYARVTNSTNFGIDALNTKTVELVDSVFENNGGAGGNSVRFRADTQSDYSLLVYRTTITDSSDAAIGVSTFGSGDGSSLTFQVYDTEITTSRFGASGIGIDWNGAIVGSILNSTFEGTGGSNAGVDVTTTSTSELVELAVSQNTFAFHGGDDVGMRFTTTGPAQIVAGLNAIAFEGSGGTGFDFNLAESAEVSVYNNYIVDNVSGGTGILFSSIAGPSTVTLQSNTIDLLSTTSVIDRGIIFNSVTGTVELLDPMNNIVNGATTAFYAPVGSLTGHTYVNGETVP